MVIIKFRLGFVTNSSSSSFLLAFNNEGEIESLGLDKKSYVYKMLHNSEDLISIDEALSRYAMYLKEGIEYFIDADIREDKNLSYSLFHEWKNLNPEEYEKERSHYYKKHYFDVIKELKNKLKDKNIICLINCWDDDLICDLLEKICVINWDDN